MYLTALKCALEVANLANLCVLLLLLLSRFSRVQLCATPQMASYQAPLSLGFSRQEHWSGLPFPSPMHESESEAAQSCPTLSDLMDCSLPGCSVHGIFQARVLEWDAIAFSEIYVYFITIEKYFSKGIPFRKTGQSPYLKISSGYQIYDLWLQQKINELKFPSFML